MISCTSTIATLTSSSSHDTIDLISVYPLSTAGSNHRSTKFLVCVSGIIFENLAGFPNRRYTTRLKTSSAEEATTANTLDQKIVILDPDEVVLDEGCNGTLVVLVGLMGAMVGLGVGACNKQAGVALETGDMS